MGELALCRFSVTRVCACTTRKHIFLAKYLCSDASHDICPSLKREKDE